MRFSIVEGTNPASLEVSFTPSVSQAGAVFSFCFSSSSEDFFGCRLPQFGGGQACMEFEVMKCSLCTAEQVGHLFASSQAHTGHIHQHREAVQHDVAERVDGV